VDLPEPTYRERLLTEGELSRRTIQKIFVQLFTLLPEFGANTLLRAIDTGHIDGLAAHGVAVVAHGRRAQRLLVLNASPSATTWSAGPRALGPAGAVGRSSH
jgi:hypothetical protein